MNIVIDASAILAVVLEEPERPDILRSTRNHHVLSAETLPFEVGNALMALVKRRVHEAEETRLAWSAFEAVPVELRKFDIGKALDIAVRRGTYAYDAYIIQAAVELRAPLLSLDRRLNGAARDEGVSVIWERSS